MISREGSKKNLCTSPTIVDPISKKILSGTFFLAHQAHKLQQHMRGCEGHILHPKKSILWQRNTSSVALKQLPMPKRLRHVTDVSAMMSAALLTQQRASASASASASTSLCKHQRQCQRQPMSVSVPAPLSAPALSSAPAPAPSSAPVLAYPPATQCDLRCIAITGASLSALSSPKLKRSGTSNTTQVMGPATVSAAASALALKPTPLPLHALGTKHVRKQHIQLQRCILQGPGKLYYIIF